MILFICLIDRDEVCPNSVAVLCTLTCSHVFSSAQVKERLLKCLHTSVVVSSGGGRRSCLQVCPLILGGQLGPQRPGQGQQTGAAAQRQAGVWQS